MEEKHDVNYGTIQTKKKWRKVPKHVVKDAVLMYRSTNKTLSEVAKHFGMKAGNLSYHNTRFNSALGRKKNGSPKLPVTEQRGAYYRVRNCLQVDFNAKGTKQMLELAQYLTDKGINWKVL